MYDILSSRDSQLDDLLTRICIKLELTDTQRNSAKDRYVAIGKWLGDPESILAKMNSIIYAQGSLRLDTTVKPIKYEEYDLDIVCELTNFTGTEGPVETLNLIEARLKQHETYRAMIERKNRCIRINYANEFHMDIMPAYPDRSNHEGCLLVPDRAEDNWSPSNPKGYAEWFDHRCLNRIFLEARAKLEPFPDHDEAPRKPPLKRIVQLMKRHRDIVFQKEDGDAPVSVVLTTLAGHHYSGSYFVNEGLGQILTGICGSIPAVGRLIVLNPAHQDEDFSEKWDNNPLNYKLFKKWVREFAQEWQLLRATSGLESISEKLRSMFGETVADMAFKEQAAAIQKQREKNSLHVAINKNVGLTTIIGSGSVPIAKNTFFGE